jgi:hypothetical protein
MASINFIDMKNGDIYINLKLTKGEYRILDQETENLIILPVNEKAFSRELTTGKLGNSNRIMLPKKFLAKKNVIELEKKVMGNIFDVNGSTFLIVRLKEHRVGIPKFIEVKK